MDDEKQNIFIQWDEIKYRYAYICFFLYNTCIVYLFLAFKQNKIVHYNFFQTIEYINLPKGILEITMIDWLVQLPVDKKLQMLAISIIMKYYRIRMIL